MFDFYKSEVQEGRVGKNISSIYSLIDKNRKKLIVRIRSITLENFKSVKYGKIDLIEGHKPTLFSEEPNILGLYGQNGSGKTTVVVALDLLKCILGGGAVPERYNTIVSNDAEKATMKTTFEFQERGSEVVELITYEFSLKREISGDDEKCKICDEKVIIKKIGYDGSLIQKSKTVFDSNSRDTVKNGHKFKAMVVGRKYHKTKTWIFEEDISYDRNNAFEEGRSVFFGSEYITHLSGVDFRSIPFDDESDRTTFLLPGSEYDYLILLQDIVKIRIAAAAAFNVFSFSTNPVFIPFGDPLSFDEKGIATILDDDEEPLKRYLENLSIIMSEIIPGLTLKYEVIDTIKEEHEIEFSLFIKNLFKKKDEVKATADDLSDEDLYYYRKVIRLFTERDSIKVPISDESEGIKRLIYEMSVFTEAFNNPGVITVIDEFDAGVYEYLLGEILQLFERFGQGQFIFTSHNLRPLEVLSRKFICFTTANKDNRYVKIKNLGKTNNLRDVYLRTIYANDREVKLYEKRKSYQIAEALRKAGQFI